MAGSPGHQLADPDHQQWSPHNAQICAAGAERGIDAATAPNGGYLKSSLREALVGRVFCVVDMSQCSIWVFDRDSQYPTGISDAPFLLLVLGMKHLSCVGAWIAADQGCG
jgi:hypothetical protein